MCFIERCAENRIGFYCWKLFKMNQISSWEVIYDNYLNLSLSFSLLIVGYRNGMPLAESYRIVIEFNAIL